MYKLNILAIGWKDNIIFGNIAIKIRLLYCWMDKERYKLYLEILYFRY
jgi:hypothetical protein